VFSGTYHATSPRLAGWLVGWRLLVHRGAAHRPYAAAVSHSERGYVAFGGDPRVQPEALCGNLASIAVAFYK